MGDSVVGVGGEGGWGSYAYACPDVPFSSGGTDNYPCKLPGGEACDSASFKGSCTASVATCCHNGHVELLDCAKIDRVCVAEGTDVVSVSCQPSARCPGQTVPNLPKLLAFCDGDAGIATFDCSLAGVLYDGQASKLAGATVP